MIRWIPWGDGELEVLDAEEMSVDVALDRVQEAVEAVFSGEGALDDDDEDDFEEDDLEDDDPEPAH